MTIARELITFLFMTASAISAATVMVQGAIW